MLTLVTDLETVTPPVCKTVLLHLCAKQSCWIYWQTNTYHHYVLTPVTDMETVWVTPAVHKSVLLNSDTDRLEKRIIPQNQGVPLVEFMHFGLYNLFTAPGEDGTKGEWSLSCSNCVMSFECQLTSLVCWSYTNTTGLVLFQILCGPFKLINFATGDRSVHISMVYNLTTRKNSGGNSFVDPK